MQKYKFAIDWGILRPLSVLLFIGAAMSLLQQHWLIGILCLLDIFLLGVVAGSILRKDERFYTLSNPDIKEEIEAYYKIDDEHTELSPNESMLLGKSLMATSLLFAINIVFLLRLNHVYIGLIVLYAITAWVSGFIVQFMMIGILMFIMKIKKGRNQ
ncbi:MAG TPA: hypothetical protein VNW29_05720 [Candidatus Sulfotelmatobacter sp.]|jgi:hypothetical protein|nr:hypothetical protein [Candidatus Sulfotelmatobacter sp.]